MNYNISKRKISKYNFFFILFIISQFSIYSQSDDTLEIKDKSELVFDSLVAELNKSSIDTIKVNMLNEIAWEFAPTNFKKSMLYADSARALAKNIDWKKGEAIAIKNAGEALRFNGKVEESILKFETCLPIFKRLNDQNEIARVYNHLGLSCRFLSKFEKSYKYFNKALIIYEDLDDINGKIKGLTYLGSLFLKFNNYSKSLENYEKALVIAEKKEKNSTYANIITNIGMIYSKQKNYKDALSYYLKASRIFKSLKSLRYYSQNLGNIGDLYSKQQKYRKALLYSEKALFYFEKINEKGGIAYQSANLGEIQYDYAMNKNHNLSNKKVNALLNSAVDNFNKSILVFDELGNKVELIYSLNLLADVYLQKKNFQGASVVLKRSQVLKDSLQVAKVNQVIADAEYQKDLELKQREIAILNAENDYERLSKGVLIGIAVLLVFFAIYLYMQYRSKLTHAKILEENIQIREKAERDLKNNENELIKHKSQLEQIVKKRTSELESEINERKMTEEDLLIAIDRVESANKAKSIFLENMSHELRTPLVGILGYSQLLHSEIEDRDFKEMADGINRTGNRLLNTLSMVLDLARIESDKFEINITEIDVEAELEQIYNSFKGAVAIKNIEFSLNLCEKCKTLYSDAGMFKVIVENLVNNAIKFTKKGEIVIETEIVKTESGKDFLINVSDTGIGIKRNEISMIFNEFKQLSEGTVKDFQGTGLGLSISKKFIEHLNGELLVESTFGVGSKFTLKFPYH